MFIEDFVYGVFLQFSCALKIFEYKSVFSQILRSKYLLCLAQAYPAAASAFLHPCAFLYKTVAYLQKLKKTRQCHELNC